MRNLKAEYEGEKGGIMQSGGNYKENRRAKRTDQDMLGKVEVSNELGKDR